MDELFQQFETCFDFALIMHEPPVSTFRITLSGGGEVVANFYPAHGQVPHEYTIHAAPHWVEGEVEVNGSPLDTQDPRSLLLNYFMSKGANVLESSLLTEAWLSQLQEFFQTIIAGVQASLDFNDLEALLLAELRRQRRIYEAATV